jgi:hypothetical protein
MLAVSLAFAAIGLGLLWTGEGPMRAVGLGCAAFFAGCAIVFAVQLLPTETPRPDAQGATLILPSRARLAGLTIAGVLLAAACPQIAALASTDGDAFTVWVALFGTAFFGVCALVGMLRLLRPTALYRLDHVGIANLQGAGWFIPWRAIRGVDAFAVRDEYFLALDVDPAIGAAGRFAAKLNQFAGLPGVAIGPQGSSVRFDEFAELVQRYWERGRLMQAHN